jgi:hypothetical protein
MRYNSRLAVRGILILCTTGACAPTCINQVLDQATSPSGARVAYLYSRSCGATTGPSTHVAVLEIGSQPPDGLGNVLVIKDPAAIGETRQTTQIRWIAADSLHVSLLGGRSIQSSKSSVAGVVVVFARHDALPVDPSP